MGIEIKLVGLTTSEILLGREDLLAVRSNE